MANLGSLVISLEANIARFTSDMGKAAYVAEQNSRQIQKSVDNLKNSFLALAGTAIAMAGVSNVWDNLKGIYDAEKSLVKMSERLGVNVVELQELQYAGKKAGVDLEIFNTSIQRMEKNISAAALPVKNTTGLMGEFGAEAAKGSEALRNIGIRPEALKLLPLKEQLIAISERLKLVPNEADKVRVALDLFGKGGGGMVVMLKAGEKAIEDWIIQGRKAGVVTDEEMIKKGARAAQSISLMGDAWKGLGLALADVVAEPLTALAQKYTETLTTMRGGIDTITSAGISYGTLSKNILLLVTAYKLVGYAAPLATAAINASGVGALGAVAGWAAVTAKIQLAAAALATFMVYKTFPMPGTDEMGNPIGGSPSAALPSAKRGPTTDPNATIERLRKWQEMQLFNQPSSGKVGKSGGGGADAEAQRLMTIYNTLFSDISKLSEGSLSGIEANLQKTIDQIYKKMETRVTTEAELEVMARQKAALQKQKAEEDFALFAAKESGDMYKQIEAQAKADIEKYKGFAGAKEVIDAAAARKKIEEDRKIAVEKDNLQKGYFEGMVSITMELKEQYEWRKRSLALEIKMSRDALEDSIRSKGKGLSPETANEMRSLLALTNQTKKYKMEWEHVTATTQHYSQLLHSIAGGFTSVISGIANGTMTVSQGIVSLLETVQNAFLTMVMNMVMKWAEAQIMIMVLDSTAATERISNEAPVAGAKAYSAYANIPWIGLALGAAAAALVMGTILALKSSIKSSAGGDYQVGGTDLRTVHKDETILPAWAAKSWRDIVSREEMGGTRPGENGGASGGETHFHGDIVIKVPAHPGWTQQEWDRQAPMIKNAINRKYSSNRGQGGIGNGRY